MKALVLTAFGGPENFELKEIPKPNVRHGTLLIKLAATSVNSIDIKIREGALAIAPSLPAVLGSDIAGTVVEVGEGVLGFSAGDEVYG
jgi:NADPH:quinone reductase